MPFFEDSYQTTTGSVMKTTPIVGALKAAFIKDGLDVVSLDVNKVGDVKPVFVLGSMSSEADIPLFTHPILVLDHRHEKALCTDMRFYVDKGTSATEILSGIRNLTEFNFAKSRAILNLLWVNHREGEIRSNLSFAGKIYATWMSQSISKSFALDFKDQTVIAVVAHFFYQSLFTEEVTFDEEAKQRMATHTINATGAPAEMVFQVFDKITKEVPTVKGIEELCKMMAVAVENVRLKDFDVVALLHILRNTWYGTNSKEIIAVATEHPPTWCAVVYSALTERTYRNSTVARVAEQHGKRGLSETFEKNYRVIMNESVTRRDGPRGLSPAYEELHALGTLD